MSSPFDGKPMVIFSRFIRDSADGNGDIFGNLNVTLRKSFCPIRPVKFPWLQDKWDMFSAGISNKVMLKGN